MFLVPQELVVALSHLVVQYESNFCTVALQFIEEEKNYPLPSPAAPGGRLALSGQMQGLEVLGNYLRSFPSTVSCLLVGIHQRALW